MVLAGQGAASPASFSGGRGPPPLILSPAPPGAPMPEGRGASDAPRGRGREKGGGKRDPGRPSPRLQPLAQTGRPTGSPLSPSARASASPSGNSGQQPQPPPPALRSGEQGTRRGGVLGGSAGGGLEQLRHWADAGQSRPGLLPPPPGAGREGGGRARRREGRLDSCGEAGCGGSSPPARKAGRASGLPAGTGVPSPGRACAARAPGGGGRGGGDGREPRSLPGRKRAAKPARLG